MSTTEWQLSGQYFETCNCDYVCPCVPSGLAARPTKGDCIFAMAFNVERGRYGGTSLDGLTFVVIGRTPEEMGKGNWSVGIIADERATQQQRDALVAIGGGGAGGPMANLAPMVTKFLGVEAGPIEFRGSGKSWSISVPGLLDEAAEGVPGIGGSSEPMHLDNTGHPANDRFALAKATRSHLHAFGINWDDVSGRNNGQFAPFNWHG
jgi:hypothetical protein